MASAANNRAAQSKNGAALFQTVNASLLQSRKMAAPVNGRERLRFGGHTRS